MFRRDLRVLACSAVKVSFLLIALSVSLIAQGRNPVIVIPGITGSELINKKPGELIWFKATKPKSEDLRLPISTDPAQEHDDLTPGDVVRSVKIGPVPVIDVYDGLIRAMELRGSYHEEKWDAPSADGDHDAIYVFPYDWRLDNVENARRLVRDVEALKLKLKRPDLKFDIVAHSMGGIISRYAAMYGDAELPAGDKKLVPTWAGAKLFEKVILMGTPNEGSATSLSALVQGFTVGGIRIDLPFVQDTSKFTIFTLPSIYQLLPAPGTFRAFNDRLEKIDVDIYDPKTWTKYGWNPIDDPGFASAFSTAERQTAAAFFAMELARAKRLHEALAAAQGKAVGMRFFVVGSDCRTALDSIVLYRESNSWKTIFRPKGFTRADGTKVSDADLKKIMMSRGDGVVTDRSLEAITQSQTAGVQSILGGGNGKMICEEHNRLAANSRIQDHVIWLLDKKAKAEKQTGNLN
jgi:pimeloyl-ACP methyl ester carboxylesterase